MSQVQRGMIAYDVVVELRLPAEERRKLEMERLRERLMRERRGS